MERRRRQNRVERQREQDRVGRRNRVRLRRKDRVKRIQDKTEWDGGEDKTEWNGDKSDDNRSTTEWDGKGEREIKLLAQFITELLRALLIAGARHLYIQTASACRHVQLLSSPASFSHIPTLRSCIASSYIHRFALRPSCVPLAFPTLLLPASLSCL